MSMDPTAEARRVATELVLTWQKEPLHGNARDILIERIATSLAAKDVEIESLKREKDAAIQMKASAGISAMLDMQERNELVGLRTGRDNLRFAVASIAQLVGVHSGPDLTMLSSVEGKFMELLEKLGQTARERDNLKALLMEAHPIMLQLRRELGFKSVESTAQIMAAKWLSHPNVVEAVKEVKIL